MKSTLFAVVLVFICLPANALDFDPFAGPKPVAVLIQTDPWSMVIGSDTPRIVIYEDGQVIYLKRDEDGTSKYVHKDLDSAELERVKANLSSFGDYTQLKQYYDLAPNVTDLPQTKIYLSYDNVGLVTSVYGLMTSDSHLPASLTFGIDSKPDSLPEQVEKLHAYLAEIEFDGAVPWEPSYVEVIIWGYDYAPEKSITWPKDWPGLASPNTLRQGDTYSIFIPGDKLPDLRKFLMTRRPRGAIEIEGKKWIADIRYTFPSEPVWRRAFRGKQN
jgi:hypothetical protein